jgi:hypothetical protein
MRLRGERTSQKGVIENPPRARGSVIGGMRSLECLMQEAEAVLWQAQPRGSGDAGGAEAGTGGNGEADQVRRGLVS